MSYPFSDSESSDSDDGIRFKTDSIRNKLPKEPDRKSRNRDSFPEKRIEYRDSFSRHRRKSRERRRSRSEERSRRSKHREERRHRKYESVRCEFDHKRSKSKEIRATKENQEVKKLASNDADKCDVNAATFEEHSICGPQLPPHFQKTQAPDESSQGNDCFGPTLPPMGPPHARDKSKDKRDNDCVIGPVLPDHLREKLCQETNESDESSIDDVYGPLPVGHAISAPSHVQLEERALQLKLDGLNPVEADATVREEWMLELPGIASNFGLGPRQFRAKPAPDMSDRSSWTDTPQDKLKKASGQMPIKLDLKKEARLQKIQQRDKEQEKIAKEHKKKKKRDKSLLELHQDKLKKKKNELKEAGETTRRPFDRDIDLKINRFDEAQKKAVFKKAQFLNDRFSRGESKFL